MGEGKVVMLVSRLGLVEELALLGVRVSVRVVRRVRGMLRVRRE